MKANSTKNFFFSVKFVGFTTTIFSVFLFLLVVFGCFKNLAPEKPVISGRNTTRKGDTTYIKVFSIDPEDNNICYLIEWGDTTKPRWSPFFPSGETITRAHIYSDTGTYFIKVKAKDIDRAESPWSDRFKLQIQ